MIFRVRTHHVGFSAFWCIPGSRRAIGATAFLDLGDRGPAGCSSIVAWGSKTSDGTAYMGPDLNFPELARDLVANFGIITVYKFVKLAAVWFTLSALTVPPASAEEIHRIAVGLGYGPQGGDNPSQQYNAVVDFNLFLQEIPILRLGRSALLLGVGYSYLWTDIDINSENQVISFLPACRYYFNPFKNSQLFIHMAVGPSIMLNNDLGYQHQGSKFVFNDYFGVGARFGKHNQWELSLVWRHLSNANLSKPNNGYDVPLTFMLGRVF